jgi:predicted transcriptional regulator
MMRSEPPTVQPDSTIDSLVHDQIMGTDDHAFPVVENGQLVGLITLEDVRKVSRDNWGTTTVRDAMTPTEDLVMVTADEDAADTLNKLSRRDVRQLPVVENGGSLAGVLRRRDIVRWLQLQSEEEGRGFGGSRPRI